MKTASVAIALLLGVCLAALLAACGGDGEPAGTPAATEGPAAPTAGKIAFESNRDGNYEIYVMNADGSGQTNLTDNPASDGIPGWSP